MIGVVRLLLFPLLLLTAFAACNPAPIPTSSPIPTASPNPNIGKIRVKEQQLAVIKSDISLTDRKIDERMSGIFDVQSGLTSALTRMMGNVSRCNPSALPLRPPFRGSIIQPDIDCDYARAEQQNILFLQRKLRVLQSELEELMAEREVLVHNQARVESEIRSLR